MYYTFEIIYLIYYFLITVLFCSKVLICILYLYIYHMYNIVTIQLIFLNLICNICMGYLFNNLYILKYLSITILEYF